MQSIFSLFSQRYHERAAERDRNRGYVKHYKKIFPKTQEDIFSVYSCTITEINNFYIHKIGHPQRETILNITIFATNFNYFLNICEQICKLPIIQYYKNITMTRVFPQRPYVSVNYNWNETQQRYYSLFNNAINDENLQKSYDEYPFFRDCSFEKNYSPATE